MSPKMVPRVTDGRDGEMSATRHHRLRPWVLALGGVIVLSLACASLEEKGVEKRHVGAGIGVGVGAAIGAVAGRNWESAAAGAAAGGALGYGVGWLVEQYQVRKTRDADEVAEQYGPPPESGPPKVDGYQTWMDPGAIRSGSEVGWISSFAIQIPPTSEVVVTEERALIDPDGNTISRRTYDYSKDVTANGEYQFELTIPIPESAPQGRYGFQTRLTVGDAEVGRLAGELQIAATEDGGRRVVAWIPSTGDEWPADRLAPFVMRRGAGASPQGLGLSSIEWTSSMAKENS